LSHSLSPPFFALVNFPVGFHFYAWVDLDLDPPI
jgi:hypothetical protein